MTGSGFKKERKEKEKITIGQIKFYIQEYIATKILHHVTYHLYYDYFRTTFFPDIRYTTMSLHVNHGNTGGAFSISARANIKESDVIPLIKKIEKRNEKILLHEIIIYPETEEHLVDEILITYNSKNNKLNKYLIGYTIAELDELYDCLKNKKIEPDKSLNINQINNFFKLAKFIDGKVRFQVYYFYKVLKDFKIKIYKFDWSTTYHILKNDAEIQNMERSINKITERDVISQTYKHMVHSIEINKLPRNKLFIKIIKKHGVKNINDINSIDKKRKILEDIYNVYRSIIRKNSAKK